MSEVKIRVIDAYIYRFSPVKGTEFLLLRRSPGVIYAGQWRMVGGKIKADETAWQAAIREVREETGRLPHWLWTIPSVNCFYEWQHDRVNLVPAFAVEIEEDPIVNNEHDAFIWCSLEDALTYVSWPEHQRLLQLIDAQLKQGIPKELMLPVEPRDKSG